MDCSNYTTFKAGLRPILQSPSREFSVSVRQANGHLDTNKKRDMNPELLYKIGQ